MEHLKRIFVGFGFLCLACIILLISVCSGVFFRNNPLAILTILIPILILMVSWLIGTFVRSP